MELQELSVLAEESKKKKGRMDSVARERAAQLIARVWSDANVDPAGSFESLTELQSEAVAEGIGNAWPQMGQARRDLFLSWLPGPATDRTARRVGLVAGAVIDTDGRTAADLLCKLIPAGRRNSSKEMRQMLRAIFFGEKRIKFETLGQPGNSPDSVLRIYSALADIAFDAAFDISPVIRSRFALALRISLRPLESHDVQRTSELHTRIADEVKRWPSALQEQFQRQLESIEPKSESQTPPPAKPTEPPPVHGNIDVLTQLSNIQEELDSRVAAILRDVEFLRQLGTAMAQIKNQYQSLQTEVAFAKDQAAESSERAGRASELNHNLESQLREQGAKESELTKLLDQTRSEREAEKKHLSQQISANAAGRIDEFRNRLGLVLARLVVDLPQKDAPVSPELGRVLLLQFHQFLDALRHEGIETRPRIAARP